ncbi:MAG TPA: DmsC/YnfH family molybdoenzyme membrane anchor subunit [Prosthecobacter sp.]
MIYDLEDTVSGDGLRTPAPGVSPASGSDADSVLDSLFLENLLEQQQCLRTPVTVFSDAYDQNANARRFSHLIPLSQPGPGEQYSFEVNLDSCTGCKACVAACHSLNGLDESESWRDIGLLVGTRKQPYLQTVTTACHHCADPACLSGCPVLAYDKDLITGIVRHLDDQCIGCSYCILKCPYDVPKFNLKRGIVRKCDMCQGRLAEGEAPGCVQACPNEAIKIKTVKVEAVPVFGSILTGAFDSSYTKPTTRYISSKPLPFQARPADEGSLKLDHGHDPLAWMLVLTQMSAGGFIGCAVALGMGLLTADQAAITSGVSLFFGLIGIALSVLHLGQPLKAWRAFMGWKRSWLSREILAFGALPAGGGAIGAAWWFGQTHLLLPAVAGTAAAALTAVLCSVMVYVDTHRPFWSLTQTSGKFLGTMLVLGAALCTATWAWLGLPIAAAALGITLALRWTHSIWEMTRYWQALEDETSPWHRSALILHKHLRHRVELRGVLLAISALVLPALIGGGASAAWMTTLSLILMFFSQWIERQYFFTAAAGPKMPGN